MAAPAEHPDADSLHVPQALLRELEQALRTIPGGSVELVIHEVVSFSLERREKSIIDAELTCRK
jgi:hypothetical protein